MIERSTERGATFERRMGPLAGARSRVADVRRAVRAAARALAMLIVTPALLWLGACASLPSDVPRTPSTAIGADAATPLARVAAASTPPDQAQLSGLRLLGDAAQAFELRLALVRLAQTSLDLQYYLIAQDDSGAQLLDELERAARRGVRVRLLLDDLHAAGLEPALQRLAALPQAEVRLFNPLPSRVGNVWSTRMLLSLHEFGRVNRRMHNKLFIADNSFAVSGGRNIGDDYFMRGSTSHFIDMDLLASGAIVSELSQLFDRFWNSTQAFPIASLSTAAAAPGAVVAARTGSADAASDDALLRELGRGRVALQFASVRLLADAPDKAAAPGSAPALPTAMDGVQQLFGAALAEIEVVSPYFVPGQSGMALIRAAAASRVRFAVTTNSLASTDEPLAYLGYARYRDAMLDLGVHIVEVSAVDAPRVGLHSGRSGSVGRLHAKVATIDRRWLLLGSLNMDARSAHTNTELVLVIDSAPLAAEVSALLHRHWQDDHYQLRRAPAGVWLGVAAPPAADTTPWQVEWVSAGADVPRVHAGEPGVTLFARMWFGLMSLFVPEDWL